MTSLPFRNEIRANPEDASQIHSEPSDGAGQSGTDLPAIVERRVGSAKPLGRPPLNGAAMSNAQRQQRYRKKQKAKKRQLEIF